MDLIKKFGIEKCKFILDNAPEGAEMWWDLPLFHTTCSVLYYRWLSDDLFLFDEKEGWIKSVYHDGCDSISDQLELLSELGTAIDDAERGLLVVGDSRKVAHAIRDITDNCSDIRNHISPNTKVIER